MAYTTIKKSTDYFKAFAFTGSGSAGTKTGVGFTPDMFWHKNRDSNQGHGIIDVIRGNGNYIVPNSNSAELSDVGNYGIATDGYTFPNGDSFFNNGNMIYWNWKAGGSASSNSNGSITSSVSANTTSGFSIVSWTHNNSANYTVGHGLGATPKMLLAKTRSGAYNWDVYHSDISSGNRLKLNSTDAQGAGYWGANTVNNNTFSIGSGLASNGTTMIAYCFAEKTGYSKFGSYTGNGNADGTFVYTGFKPAFVMTKRTDATQGWVIWDNKRPGYNLTNQSLTANENGAEETGRTFDMVSNGFKIKDTNTATNASGGNYIYMAFAEQPLVGDSPATAR